jgi:Xaa-Pro aminopeptidase
MVRNIGPTIESSADLLQQSTSVWTEYQLQTHLEAAKVLENTVDLVWNLIAFSMDTKKPLSEWDVQQFMLQEFEKHGCYTDSPPICARNANSALPHYSPDKRNKTLIQPEDFILIDLWCKKKGVGSVYADIARVAVVAKKPSMQQQEVFNVVKAARDEGMDLITQRLEKGLPIMGCEVDQACRDVIIASGYGDYFTHRTGHNIGENDHGDGANIDNFETQDRRKLLPGTCFSIEPGIYLPKEFGVRLEHNVFIEHDEKSCRVTGGLQTNIVCLERYTRT